MTGQITGLQNMHVEELVLEVRLLNASTVELLENLDVNLAITVVEVRLSFVVCDLVETQQIKFVLLENKFNI